MQVSHSNWAWRLVPLGSGHGARNQLISDERRRIASELHDSTVQLLVGALFSLRIAEQRHRDSSHPAVQPLSEGHRCVQAALDAMRDAIFALRPRPSETSKLLATVHELRGRFASRPMAVHLASPPDLSALPAIEDATVGIIGEAITNAGNHSGALAVWVEVVMRDDAVTIMVRDNGKGFDLREVERRTWHGKNIGLYLLREHARRVGGSLTITSRPHAGTVVRARLPYSNAKPATGRADPDPGGRSRDSVAVGK